MAFSVHALASGSSGNSTLIRHTHGSTETALLIDAGVTIQKMKVALEEFRLTPQMLSGIVVTHEHIDHVKSVVPLCARYQIPIIANSRTLAKLIPPGVDIPTTVLPTGNRITLDGLEIETFSVMHDAVDPVGVNIYADGFKMSQITDAGCITPSMRRAIKHANLLIIEANHDVYRLKSGPYPDRLKRRILSDKGHLSNETTVGYLVDHVLEFGPCAMWLAHLSKTNNLPKLALNYARATLKARTDCPFVLDIALRDKPSLSWSPGLIPVQLNLFQ